MNDREIVRAGAAGFRGSPQLLLTLLSQSPLPSSTGPKDPDQFFTWMSVDPVDGSVNIIYYDRREGDGSGVHVYLARSIDGGRVACLWTHATPEANVLRATVLDFRGR